jgi:long-chain acyl-CoA synthetase
METTTPSSQAGLKTFVDYLYHWEKTQPNKVFLRQPFGNEFKDFTWGKK